MKFITQILVVLLLIPASVAAQYSSVVAVDPAQEGSSIAIEIPLAGSSALSGLKWFHNDGDQVFPKVVIVEGQAGLPPDLTNPGLILDEVSGVSMGWGQICSYHKEESLSRQSAIELTYTKAKDVTLSL